MSVDSSQFTYYVKKFGWINDFALSTAQAEADRRASSLEFVALERGLIDATKLDIIRTLQGRNEPINGYEIEDLLGVGGMGVVYRARQTALDRVVALKTISVKQLTEKTVLERFEKEAKTLAQLRHPHIVSAIDYGQQSERVFFVMEYIKGEDLQQTLFKCPRKFGESEVWEIIRQAASGLAHAAKHDVVHRDIKPANLILEHVDEAEHGHALHVRIADFGLARLSQATEENQLTSTGLVVGSPRYMAPEQIDHSGLTSQADVYGLGVTAWEMLSGEKPHVGLTVMEIMHEKLSAGLTPLIEMQPGYHPETYAIISTMLNRDPASRPTPAELERFPLRSLQIPTRLEEVDAGLGGDGLLDVSNGFD